jgi:hypothetical protein
MQRDIVLDPRPVQATGFYAPAGSPFVSDPNGILTAVAYNPKTGVVSATLDAGGPDAGDLEDAAWLFWPLRDDRGRLVTGEAPTLQQPKVTVRHVSGADGTAVEVAAALTDDTTVASLNAVCAGLTYPTPSGRGARHSFVEAGVATLGAEDDVPTELLGGVIGHGGLFSNTDGTTSWETWTSDGMNAAGDQITGGHRSRTLSGLRVQLGTGQWYLALAIWRGGALASAEDYAWQVAAWCEAFPDDLAVQPAP